MTMSVKSQSADVALKHRLSETIPPSPYASVSIHPHPINLPFHESMSMFIDESVPTVKIEDEADEGHVSSELNSCRFTYEHHRGSKRSSNINLSGNLKKHCSSKELVSRIKCLRRSSPRSRTKLFHAAESGIECQESGSLHLPPFPCKNCHERFDETSDLNFHINWKHRKGINCTEPGCKQVFQSISALEDHIRSHHFSSIFIDCLGCNMKHVMSEEFNLHLACSPTCLEFAIRCNHYKCHQKYFASAEALQLHTNVWHINPSLRPFTCSFDDCGEKFDSSELLRNHDMKTHPDQSFPCEKCQKSFKAVSYLKQHIINIHDNKKPEVDYNQSYSKKLNPVPGTQFKKPLIKIKMPVSSIKCQDPVHAQCQVKQASPFQSPQPAAHIKLKTPASPKKSQISESRPTCQESKGTTEVSRKFEKVTSVIKSQNPVSFIESKVPITTMNIGKSSQSAFNSDAPKFVYSKLNRTYGAKKQIIKEIPIGPSPPSGIKPQEEPPGLDNGASTITAFDLDDEVPVVRKSLNTRTYGIQITPSDMDVVPSPPLRPLGYFPCHNCLEFFNAEDDLNIHMKTHGEGINCTEPGCKRLMTSIRSLEDHIRRYHFPAKSIVCSGCNVKHVSSQKFNSHLKGNTICSVLASRCNECPKRYFASTEALELHTQISHIAPPLKRFVCSFDGCAEQFDSRTQLNCHVRAHSAPLKVKILKRDLPKSYPSIPCKLCQKLFMTVDYLKRHIKKYHSSST